MKVLPHIPKTNCFKVTRFNEGFIRLLNMRLSGKLRRVVAVEMSNSEILFYQDCCNSFAKPTCLFPIKGQKEGHIGVVNFHLDLIELLVDVSMGGVDKYDLSAKRENITCWEEKIVHSYTPDLLMAIEEGLKPIRPMANLELLSPVTDPELNTFSNMREPFFVMLFMITINNRSGKLTVGLAKTPFS